MTRKGYAQIMVSRDLHNELKKISSVNGLSMAKFIGKILELCKSQPPMSASSGFNVVVPVGKRTTVSLHINKDLLKRAKELELNLSKIFESAVAREVQKLSQPNFKKCDLCKRYAVAVVTHVKSGKEMAVCERHKADCLESGKWRLKEER